MQMDSGETTTGRQSSGTVLVVDDNDDGRMLAIHALERSGFTCLAALTGGEAIEIAMENADTIDAIVLDVNMPRMDGFEVLRTLTRFPATASIPVIFLTGGATSDADIVRGVDSGAIDYITKPCSPSVLVAKLRGAVERARSERKLRRDLSFAELHATVDVLTGLFNRRHLDMRLSEATAASKRRDETYAVVMIDIDHFKRVNDAHGHEEGDRVLIHFSDGIRSVLRSEDIAFRYGGEEFVMLLNRCDAERAMEVTERLRIHLGSNPFEFTNGTYRPIKFSAGVTAARPDEQYSSSHLVARADAALYRAKNAGRDHTEASRDADVAA